VYLAKGALAAVRAGSAHVQANVQANAQANAQAADLQANQAVAVARFFAETLATAAPGLRETVLAGAEATLTMTPAALSNS
jgi:hypothetical protein